MRAWSLRHRAATAHGVTLVEMLAVAVVLGVFALIVAPNIENAVGLSKTSALETSISILQDESDSFYAQKGAYPSFPGTAVANQPSNGVWGVEINNSADPNGLTFTPNFIHQPATVSAASMGLNPAAGPTLYYGVDQNGQAFATQVAPKVAGPGEGYWGSAPSSYWLPDGDPNGSSGTGILAAVNGENYLEVWNGSSWTVIGRPTVNGTQNDLFGPVGYLPTGAVVTGAQAGAYTWSASAGWTWLPSPYTSASYPNGTPVAPTVCGSTIYGVVNEAYGYNTAAVWTGTTWSVMGTIPASVNVLACGGPNDQEVAIGTDAGVYIWNSATATWTSIGDSAYWEQVTQVNGIAISPTGLIAAGTTGAGFGVWNGSAWDTVTQGSSTSTATYHFAFLADGSLLVATNWNVGSATVSDYTSSDGWAASSPSAASTWATLSGTAQVEQMAQSASNGKVAVAISSHNAGGAGGGIATVSASGLTFFTNPADSQGYNIPSFYGVNWAQ